MNKMRSAEKIEQWCPAAKERRIGLNPIDGQLWDCHQWYSRFIAQDE
jgi:hypothetical protein